MAIGYPDLLGINNFTCHAKRSIKRQHWEKWRFVCQEVTGAGILFYLSIELNLFSNLCKEKCDFLNLHTSVQCASHFVFFFSHVQLNPRDMKFKQHSKTLLRKGGETKTTKYSQIAYKKVRGQRKAGDATNQFLLRLFLSTNKYLNCCWITAKQLNS